MIRIGRESQCLPYTGFLLLRLFVSLVGWLRFVKTSNCYYINIMFSSQGPLTNIYLFNVFSGLVSPAYGVAILVTDSLEDHDDRLLACKVVRVLQNIAVLSYWTTFSINLFFRLALIRSVTNTNYHPNKMFLINNVIKTTQAITSSLLA